MNKNAVYLPIAGNIFLSICLIFFSRFVQAKDINNDGFIDLSDALHGLQIISGRQDMPEINLEADINDDGKIGMAEVLFILDWVNSTMDWRQQPNEYSWDGSWTPTPEDLPLSGFFDPIYFDNHLVAGQPSPLLPPGKWDWTSSSGNISELANWHNFETNVGGVTLLKDSNQKPFGWQLNRVNESGVAVNYVMECYHGSSGADIIDFGPGGSYVTSGEPLDGYPHLGDGPDMLRYRSGSAATIRTGSSATGHAQDNDLVIAGSSEDLPAGQYDIATTTIHTGPGNDLVFINNWERAAIDLGNGNNGRTDSIDTHDGRDIVVIGGYAKDFRVFGGNGDDVFIWHVDEVNQIAGDWLGPSFFGGGSWGDALWGDPGTDRLIMNIPSDTAIISTPSSTPGTLLIMIEGNYQPSIDGPTEDDLFGRYYGHAPLGPNDEKTVTLQYRSANGSVNTAYFYITDIEEIQVGSDNNAVILEVNDITGNVTANAALLPYTLLPNRTFYENLFDTF